MAKVCSHCLIEKKISEFRKNSRCSQGVTNQCKSCSNLSQKSYRAANPGLSKGNRSEVCQRYYESNKELILRKSEDYRRSNLHKYAAYEKKRQTSKLKAMPKWLAESQLKEIENFYMIASWHNEPMHVDHIVPLQGKNVCGLHVPWNLQILAAKANISKGNRHVS